MRKGYRLWTDSSITFATGEFIHVLWGLCTLTLSLYTLLKYHQFIKIKFFNQTFILPQSKTLFFPLFMSIVINVNVLNSFAFLTVRITNKKSTVTVDVCNKQQFVFVSNCKISLNFIKISHSKHKSVIMSSIEKSR